MLIGESSQKNHKIYLEQQLKNSLIPIVYFAFQIDGPMPSKYATGYATDDAGVSGLPEIPLRIYILAWPLAGNTLILHCVPIGSMILYCVPIGPIILHCVPIGPIILHYVHIGPIILHCVPIGPMILHCVPIGLPEISRRIQILAWPLAGNTRSPARHLNKHKFGQYFFELKNQQI